MADFSPSSRIAESNELDRPLHDAIRTLGRDDTGLELTGFVDQTASQRATTFVPVDSGRAGQGCSRALVETAGAPAGR